MSECPFCQKITDGSAIQDVDDVYRFEPLNPVTPGHMLFVPRKHLSDAAWHPIVTGQVFEAAASWGDEHDEAFNLITSKGAAATQTIRHLHVHYVPRRPGDGLALPWTGQKSLADTDEGKSNGD